MVGCCSTTRFWETTLLYTTVKSSGQARSFPEPSAHKSSCVVVVVRCGLAWCHLPQRRRRARHGPMIVQVIIGRHRAAGSAVRLMLGGLADARVVRARVPVQVAARFHLLLW